MARSNMKPRGLVVLPRNWRVITAASLTTLGLVYYSGQPVLGDWRSLTKGKSESTKSTAAKPSTAKPSGSENGFGSTILRLMSDARLYADKGEWDKAVQLAERAAKISEASAQLLGPTSECSPETTKQFAEELRSRRDAMVRSTSPATNQGRSPTRGVVVTPPTTEPGKRLNVERAIAERSTPDQQPPLAKKPAFQEPAELNSEAQGVDLAWSEELPPTPAPEAEPVSKPIKFRRSIISRSTLGTDPDGDFDSQSEMEEAALPSIAEADPFEMPGVPTTGVAESEVADPFADETFREPSEPIADAQPMLDDPFPPPSVEATNSSTETTVAETLKEETVPGESTAAADVSDPFVVPSPSKSPSTEPRGSEWVDEALADEPTPESQVSIPIATIPEDSEPPKSDKTDAPPVLEGNFPVARVVQLRRRLETATSLNPGAYTMPSTSGASLKQATAPAQAEAPSPPASLSTLPVDEPAKELDFELPTSASLAPSATPASVPRKVKLRRAFASEPRQPVSNVVSAEPSLTAASGSEAFDAPSVDQSNSVPPSRPTETSTASGRPALRLREHRRLSGPVRTAMLEAAATPSSPASRKHVVGHSEPILWQSAENRKSGLPTLSIANDVTASGSEAGRGLPPDLRQVAAQSDSTGENRIDSRKSSSVSKGLPGFQDITLPVDSNSKSEPNEAMEPIDAESPPRSAHRSGTSRDLKRGTKPSLTAPVTTSSVTSFREDVSRQSFALIEPLANALQLPLATTASLLGGASLALVGLGLILIRVAMRWRHS